MTGMTTERTEDTFAQQFRDFLKPVDRETVTEIKLHKTDLAIIYCKTWDDYNRIVNDNKDSHFHGETVTFMLFSEQRPSQL